MKIPAMENISLINLKTLTLEQIIKHFEMRTLFSLFFGIVFLCSFNNILSSQVTLNNNLEAAQYLEGDWSVYLRINGWIGTDTLPSDSLEVTYNFELTDPNQPVLECSLLKNGDVIANEIVSIGSTDPYEMNIPTLPQRRDNPIMELMCILKTTKIDTLRLQSSCYVTDGNDYILLRSNVATSEKNTESIQFNYFPNPSLDILNFSSDYDKTLNLEIYTLQGKLVLKEALINPKEQLNITDLSNGVYLIILKDLTNKIIFKDKFIKSNRG